MPIALSDILKAAGEPTRLRILNLLRRGSICVCDLQAVLKLPQPTVSRHLAALRHAGLVQDFREGTRVLYSLAPATSETLKSFFAFLEAVAPGQDELRKDLSAMERATRAGQCVVLGSRAEGENSAPV
jgi:ArsR family transcriptional regulator